MRILVTWGSKLEAGVKGFPAEAMAKTSAGDWRNPARIRAWADQVAEALPSARPGPVVAPPGRGLVRVAAHALLGAAVCAALVLAMDALVSWRAGRIAFAIGAPLVFAPVAWHYFRPRGARAAVPVAVSFAVAALSALVVAGGVAGHGLAAVRGAVAPWLAPALTFLVSWGVGGIMSTLPWPRPGVPSPPPSCGEALPGSPSSLPAR